MKKIFTICLVFFSNVSKGDIWGGDLPLLAEIVTNTYWTMIELERQSNYLDRELAGINDKIYRIKTISDIVQPSTWDKWKDPNEAVKRLKLIYHTLPKEYHSAKADMVEEEISKSMELIGKLNGETKSTFLSGKELERRGADSSPGVAQKLTASGVGTLISLEAQSQVAQSQMISLLAQILSQVNEKETRAVVSHTKSFQGFSENLGQREFSFSELVLSKGWKK